MDIVFGVSPISSRVQIAQFKVFRLAEGDFGNGTRHFPCDEALAASWTFVIEQNAAAQEHFVRFTVISDHPVTIRLGNTFLETKKIDCKKHIDVDDALFFTNNNENSKLMLTETS